MSRISIFVGYDLEVHFDGERFAFEIPADMGRAASEAEVDIEQAIQLMRFIEARIAEALQHRFPSDKESQ